LRYIIDNYCEKETGVRNIKRCLEIIYTKLNLYRLLPKDSSLFRTDKEVSLTDITFPLILTKEIVDTLIHKKPATGNWTNMYI